MYLKKQQGFLIPLALVLIVGISFLAIAVSRLSGQSGTQATVEGLSVQAFYAAESGAQFAVNQLLYSAASRSAADTVCLNMTGAADDTLKFSEVGLSLCSVVLTCTMLSGASDLASFYQINSAAQCGVGQLLAERVIEVSTYYE